MQIKRYKTPVYKLLLLVGCILAWMNLSSCAGGKAQLDALGKCKYELESLDDFKVLGNRLDGEDLEMDKLSTNLLMQLSMAALTKDFPVEGILHLKISNPTNNAIKVNRFKYVLAVENLDIIEGEAVENIQIDGSGDVIVPLKFKGNLFGKDKKEGLDTILEKVLGKDKKGGMLKLKIKPSVNIAGGNVFYPSYITIDKNILTLLKAVRI